MGLDVYVGSFTRYYGGNWETVTERHAREQGIEYKRVSAHDESERLRDPVAIRRIVVERWMPSMAAALASRVSVPFDWDESDKSPYFTHKPDWSGYHALTLFASYHEQPDLTLPRDVPEDLEQDPAWQRTTAEDFSSRFDTLFWPTMWLPLDFDVTFTGPTPSGQDQTIGSSYELLRNLSVLNAERFHAGAAELQSWRRGEQLSGLTPCEALARVTFAMFCQLTGLSIERRLPMLLDY